MEQLNFDIWTDIMKLLDEPTKVSLGLTSHEMYDMLNHVKFNNCYNYRDICHLPYKHSFQNLVFYADHDFLFENYYTITTTKFSLSGFTDIAITLYVNFSDKEQIKNKIPKIANHLLLSNSNILKSIGNNITHLILDINIDENILKFLPLSISNLTIHGQIKGGIDDLPDSIINLTLHNFDSPINKYPKSLKHIDFKNFNQSIDNLPDTLTYLSLQKFNKNLTKPLKSLKYLLFGSNFDKQINGNFLKSLEHLEITNFTNIINNLPDTLKYIKFGHYFNSKLKGLPINLTHLTLDGIFNQEINELPINLTHLILGNEFNQKLENLPKFLKYLKIGNKFNQSISGLPDSLEYLELGTDFNQPVKVNTPKSLKCLILHGSIQGGFNGFNGLIELRLIDRFNRSISHIPKTIKILELGASFNQKISPIKKSNNRKTKNKYFIPPSVEHLIVHHLIENSGNIPDTVRKMTIKSDGKMLLQTIQKVPSFIKDLYIESYNPKLSQHLPSTIENICIKHLSNKKDEISSLLEKLPKTLKKCKLYKDNDYVIFDMTNNYKIIKSSSAFY